MSVREVYKFGEFTLDASERRLSNGELAVGVAPKAFDLLLGLVRNAGRLVTKRELLDLVWPESFVEDGILAVHVSALRKALREDGGRRYIETVSRSGYRFVGAVAQQSSDHGPPHGAHPEVHELVGRGRSHLLKASMVDVPKAIEVFRAALEIDPAYAPAYAGLARAYCAQAAYRLAPPAKAYSQAKAAALRALALDDSSADAQVALGAVLFFSEWDWAGAERSLKRALQLSPDHSEGYLLYGELLEVLGRLKKVFG